MNQNPEQIARDRIDQLLVAAGWIVQGKRNIDLNASLGVAVREYQTAIGHADYVLFVDKKPVGIIEAKRQEEGVRLTVHESQSYSYAVSKLKYLNNDPLVFTYESTGEVSRFTDHRDPKPRSRPVFTFHRPATLRACLKQGSSLRKRLFDIPELNSQGLRACQIQAIANLEKSLRENRPKALIQMATGAGKTFTAITFIYRLLKYAKAKRVLFLVDTKNLGEQAEQEFMAFLPNDDNRKFSELYGVHRLQSNHIPSDCQVYISTIQRLYSILKDEPLDEKAEETNPAEINWSKRKPLPVVYNDKLPIEFFDFVIVDECHRSIYNLWKQVLDYYDAFLIGLTATPDNRTFGFFEQNIVSEYTHQQAIIDQVNVGFTTYLIETEITKQGANLKCEEWVDHREKLTRKKRWHQLDEDVVYSSKRLDDQVVNLNQIRLIIRTFKERLPEIFSDRRNAQGEFEVPKTLIFAKSDSHADDIIQIVRNEFGEGNQFCKKITYRSEEDPKSILAEFRTTYYPRIAVTVDMIATGTDVKPLECLLFMRDVKSRNYFEQMKGRGTRTITLDDLKKASPSAKFAKDRFVLIDAIGVSKSLKTDSRPLEKQPSVALKDLLGAIAVGARDEALFSSLAGRLLRLDKRLTEAEKQGFQAKAQGKTIPQVARELLNAFDPDTMAEIQTQVIQEMPQASEVAQAEQIAALTHTLQEEAARVFTGELNDFIENVRKVHEQIIDHINPDRLLAVGWAEDQQTQAEETVRSFTDWIVSHREEITALQLFYGQPFQRRALTYQMIQDLANRIMQEKPTLAPLRVWQAYEQLERVNGQPKNQLIALVSLIRRVTGLDGELTTYDRTVDKNFQSWVFNKQAGNAPKFTEEQMQWLRMIKDFIASSVHFEQEDFDLVPFNQYGGLGKFYQVFGADYQAIIEELNEHLAA